jgi:hypothetical protein
MTSGRTVANVSDITPPKAMPIEPPAADPGVRRFPWRWSGNCEPDSRDGTPRWQPRDDRTRIRDTVVKVRKIA